MLSVVIPTLNAADHVAHCLDSLASGDAIIDQIIVCDGGSTDSTADICATFGARILTAPPGRGGQLRTGIAAATSPFVLILHADTRLGADWADAVCEHIETCPDMAACFRLVFDDRAWQARCLETLVGLRVAVFGLAYGDQGLLLSTSFYHAVGGFSDMTLMEDVDLIRRIGKNRLRPLSCAAITSADRYVQNGWLRQSTDNLWRLTRYWLGANPADLAQSYR